MERVTVEVQGDHLRKLASTRPVQAVAELIWNAVDADATSIAVEIERSDFGMNAIVVRDNGHAIPRVEAAALFKNLGGSWKRHGSRSKLKNRMLHGQEGKGRFKAFTLGRVVDWTSTYVSDDGEFRRFPISMVESNLREVRIGDEQIVEHGPGGVEVRITELHHEWRSLEAEDARQEFTETFALYMTDYPEVVISLDGIRLDPKLVIAGQRHFELAPIECDGQTYKVNLDLIEWRALSQKALYLCDRNGFPLARTQNRFHTGEYQFSAYLRSPFVSVLHDEGTLDLVEMNPPLQAACDEAADKIKAHFKTRSAEDAQAIVSEWKRTDIYPYRGDPLNRIEEAERQVFEIVAVNVSKHIPEFTQTPHRNQAFHLRMLRQAIERSPEDLQLILSEVLELPQRKQQELARLLKETSLTAIISAAKMVADRLKFITGLEAILFDPEPKKRLKERSQLHRILAENTWVFGEEFNLSVDDQSLTEVLRQHARRTKREIRIDEPVKRIDGKQGIVDLMLSRSIKQNREDELDHLIVELKAPKVKLGSDELTQVESYAFTIAGDERFRGVRTRWTFWALSNDMDDYGKRRSNTSNLPPGVVYKSDDPLITIHAKTWAQVIQENKSRLRFYKEHLEYTADRGSSLQFLQHTYDAYLKGVLEEDEEEPLEARDQEAPAEQEDQPVG
ncbi:MAG TPA: ATP-binding protein [Microvirga sp.]|jgi:hypothetical protein|nr:ATP-binding protein [Microvirga sp.]